MKLLIQAFLVAAVMVVVYRLITVRGARTQALRRLGMALFGIVAIFSVLVPNTWTHLANLVGVGRGADMVLYILVVAFLGYAMNSYLKFRDMETRYTRLARRIALDESLRRYPELTSRWSTMEAPTEPGRQAQDRSTLTDPDDEGTSTHRD
ncbi:DUF2304 domain-containing protein [Arsenicicoccus piscis]|uniref:DUF2304 domain-containing protein n=1 Tax=Arsenicicoccus piscis TaxID=673954 RepID=A0ABQ6HQ81_9MICO|nr:DUF2304 domain-containing protein [Arsenicicoccus piscis]MCH8629109.1 DUF2304 domain-containing protein [Arsenicicoccus piscis]GMA20332.1 hypothetical protein GCM10025862_23530 [Arsenicicoccus piscis]